MTLTLLEALRRRYSPRKYASRPLAPQDLALIFEAARWAPSAFNRQPWRFLVTRQGTEAYQRLLAVLSPGNLSWARTAPVLVLAAALEEDERGPNRYALHDLGLACGLLTAQAAALGIYPHFMAGFDKEKAREVFGLPPHVRPVTVIALGYPGPDEPPRERTRHPLHELVFEEAWERPASWAHQEERV